jgi:GT2 family glycosyltransferase
LVARDAVFLVTVVHNRRSITTAFAERLARQTLRGITLILVDDGSTDGTAEAVLKILPSTVVLKGDGTLWWGGGLQKGLTWLRAQGLADEAAVIFMNDDVSFEDDYFEKAVAELKSLDGRSFLVSPGVFHPSGRWAYEAGVTDWSRMKLMHYGEHHERIDHSTTRALFMPWGALKTVSGFHPTLVPHYTSDYVFSIAAHRQGIRLVPAQTVRAQFFDETTGDHGLARFPLRQKLARLFSPRFSSNPLHLFFFVWYSCPWQYKVFCWARIAVSTIKHLR